MGKMKKMGGKKFKFRDYTKIQVWGLSQTLSLGLGKTDLGRHSRVFTSLCLFGKIHLRGN